MLSETSIFHSSAARSSSAIPAPYNASAHPAPSDDPHEPHPPKRIFSAVHRIRVCRAHLRVDLEPLPEALSRPRGLRADAGAGAVHGRDGDRVVALQPVVGRLEKSAARL